MINQLDGGRPDGDGDAMDGHLLVIGTEDALAWSATLARAGVHDFYHLCEYHRLAEVRGEGSARLLAWVDQDAVIALPLLIRSLPPGHYASAATQPYCDATSVYGYAGPVGDPNASDRLVRGFQAAVKGWLHKTRVVSLFSRLHPLIDSSRLVDGLGTMLAHGPTVSIDLRLPTDTRRALARSNHRRDLRKLRARGFACQLNDDDRAIATFADIYLETMRRVSSTPAYLFDFAYFKQLLAIDDLALMLCTTDSEPCAGAILSFRGETAQYHLGGTRDSWLRDAPMKLIFDEASEAAAARGCTRLHLGGGLGAREDALFAFKAGFSPDRHLYRTWRWIVDAEAYEALTDECGNEAAADIFPAYRG